MQRTVVATAARSDAKKFTRSESGNANASVDESDTAVKMTPSTIVTVAKTDVGKRGSQTPEVRGQKSGSGDAWRVAEDHVASTSGAKFGVPRCDSALDRCVFLDVFLNFTIQSGVGAAALQKLVSSAAC
jgi:hypothetical protein